MKSNIQNETEGGKPGDSNQTRERSKGFATAAIGNAYAMTLLSYVILASGISYLWPPSSKIMKGNKYPSALIYHLLQLVLFIIKTFMLNVIISIIVGVLSPTLSIWSSGAAARETWNVLRKTLYFLKQGTYLIIKNILVTHVHYKIFHLL